MAGYDAFGTRLEREETVGAGDFAAVANVHSLSGPAFDREEYDVTTHESPEQWEEIIFGIKRSGEIELEVYFGPEEHLVLLDDYDSSDPRAYRLVWPDSTGADPWEFDAGLTGFEVDAPHDGPLEASMTFKLSGVPTFVAES